MAASSGGHCSTFASSAATVVGLGAKAAAIAVLMKTGLMDELEIGEPADQRDEDGHRNDANTTGRRAPERQRANDEQQPRRRPRSPAQGGGRNGACSKAERVATSSAAATTSTIARYPGRRASSVAFHHMNLGFAQPVRRRLFQNPDLRASAAYHRFPHDEPRSAPLQLSLSREDVAMSLRFDQRLDRLKTRQRELAFWRVRESARYRGLALQRRADRAWRALAERRGRG